MNRAQTKAATRRPCSWRSTRVNHDIEIQSAGNSGISAVSLSHRTNGLACRRALERADKSRHPQAMQVAVSTRKPRYCDSTRRQLRHFGCQLISPQICISLPPRWHMSAVSRKLRPWPARRAQIGAHIRMLLRHALRLDTSPPETNEHSGISPQPAHKGAKPEHHPRPRKSSSTALRQARPTTPHCLTLDTALATASKLAAVP